MGYDGPDVDATDPNALKEYLGINALDGATVNSRLGDTPPPNAKISGMKPDGDYQADHVCKYEDTIVAPDLIAALPPPAPIPNFKTDLAVAFADGVKEETPERVANHTMELRT